MQLIFIGMVQELAIKSILGSFLKLLTGEEDLNRVVYPPRPELNFGTVFKRKFRWTFSVKRDENIIETDFLLLSLLVTTIHKRNANVDHLCVSHH